VLASYGRDGTDAYDLVDRLPYGRARAAAWNAYACQTYGDKLADSCPRPSDETARVVRSLYALAVTWLERTALDAGGSQALELPAWGTPIRSRDQLLGMRETLDALRTYVAYALPPALEPRLDAIDKRLGVADALWIERPTPELRGGIGDALAAGIREAIALGQELAAGASDQGSFVPSGFVVPLDLATEQFRLEPLGPQHNESDYEAWSSSVEHIHATPGWDSSSWPDDRSLEDNLHDLERHANDFENRAGFTYTVLEPATEDVIGCVYIYPGKDEQHDAQVLSWVRAERAELDVPLWRSVTTWLESDWPFKRVAYAERA